MKFEKMEAFVLGVMITTILSYVIMFYVSDTSQSSAEIPPTHFDGLNITHHIYIGTHGKEYNSTWMITSRGNERTYSFYNIQQCDEFFNRIKGLSLNGQYNNQ